MRVVVPTCAINTSRVALSTPSAIASRHTQRIQTCQTTAWRFLATKAPAQDSSSPTATFANQRLIPRLPIPSLSATAERYLRSCEPLLSPEDMDRTRSAVQTFIRKGGFGEVLQERLKEWDEKEEVQSFPLPLGSNMFPEYSLILANTFI